MFSRFGYSISEAIADLVDNSIDAKARNVLIRFVRTPDRIARVLIVDDGHGMDDDKLSEAMRFGSKSDKPSGALGKYGFGLKTASLSQARIITVLSRCEGKAIGRRWLKSNIGRDWQCEVLNEQDVEGFLQQDFSPLEPRNSSTVVIWEELEHLMAPTAKIDAVLHRTQQLLRLELGLRFHRFIADRSSPLTIVLDQQAAGEVPSAIKVRVEPLDPFAYSRSGKAGYPKSFSIEVAPHGQLYLECHIWPPRSEESGYKLGGGKVSARQGFYVYRNDRLIQAGGWNGCRDDDSEPHLSLARVKVDLPPTFDDAFKLNVMKSHVEPPPSFVPAAKAAADRQSTFQGYINDALEVYGKNKKTAGVAFSYGHGRGFPAVARKAAAIILGEGCSCRIKRVHFSWEELEPYEFVRIDRDRGKLLLNKSFRAKVLQGRRASSADAAMVKLLLLFLLQDEFSRRVISAKSRDWLERINEAIISTLKKEG